MYHQLSSPHADAPDALNPFLRFPSAWFLFDVRDCDPTLRAQSGQAASYVRTTSTLLTMSDGSTVNAPPAMLPYDFRVVTDGPRRAGLLLGATDVLAYNVGTADRPFGPVSGRVRIIETGGVATADAGVLYVGADDQTGARIAIESNGTTYRVRFSGGGSEQVSVLPFVPSLGSVVDIAFILDSNGILQIHGSADGGDWMSGVVSAGTSLPAAWPSTTRVRLGRLGSAGTPWTGWIGYALLVRTTRTVDELRTRY